MPSILIIEDDAATRQMFAAACEHAGFAVATTGTGCSGIRLLDDVEPEVTLIDLLLPDISGLEVLKHISLTGISTNAVVITGAPSTRSAVEAIRLGAREFLEKPVAADDLVATITALSHPNARQVRASQLTPHSAVRVATIVVNAIKSRSDPRTINAWARAVGASPGTIRSWCRMAKVSSKHALDLARLLRAVVWSRHTATSPEHLLDVVDPRTLDKLLRLGDAASGRNRLPASVDELLTQQRWIRSPEIVAAIRRATQSRSPTLK